MLKVRKKPCRVCRRWFQPDPRVGDRQRVCGKPECQTARRQKTQADWRKRNPDYRTVEAHGSERRTGRRIRQFGESRKHSHARGTCRLCVRSALTKKFAQPGLKVPDSWIYEKTRGRCRYLSGSSALAARRGTGLIPFLHLGRYVRLQRPLPYVCQRNAIPCVSPSVGTFHKG